MADRYLLQKSTSTRYGWVCTDTSLGVVCQFTEGKFEETQKFTVLGDATLSATEAAAAASDMTDWLIAHHELVLTTELQGIKDDYRQSVGEQLRAAREAAGLTLHDLSAMTGIAFNHIARIERGSHNVTLDSIALICAALDAEIIIDQD